MNITTRELSDYESEILDRVLDAPGAVSSAEGGYPTRAIIAWVDERDELQMGRVRWGHRNSAPGQRDRWSASPFPGAWSDVPRDRIVLVRHPEAF